MPTATKPKATIWGFILFLVALILVPVFNTLGIIYAIFRLKTWKNAGIYYRNMATSKDQHANVCMQFLFNDLMLKNKRKNSFGDMDETISSVIGKNLRDNNLNKFGRFWNWFLEKLDKNHSIDAIEDDEGNRTRKAVKTVRIFSRKECIFNYCPHPELCKDKCQCKDQSK